MIGRGKFTEFCPNCLKYVEVEDANVNPHFSRNNFRKVKCIECSHIWALNTLPNYGRWIEDEEIND